MTKSTPLVITPDQMRLVDKLMVESFGIRLEQMMEMAGRNLADLAFELLGDLSPDIVVACGGGHNGGGGMVAARHLSNRGAKVTVILTADEGKLKPVPLGRWKTLKQLPVTLITVNELESLDLFNHADLIIDAIIGYGLSGDPHGMPAQVMREIRKSQNPNILSLDIPSGLNATTGIPGESCLRARATMTLALPKIGLMSPEAFPFVGDLYLADIGVPPELYNHLGFPSQNLFQKNAILHLKNSDL